MYPGYNFMPQMGGQFGGQQQMQPMGQPQMGQPQMGQMPPQQPPSGQLPPMGGQQQMQPSGQLPPMGAPQQGQMGQLPPVFSQGFQQHPGMNPMQRYQQWASMFPQYSGMGGGIGSSLGTLAGWAMHKAKVF